MAKQEVFLNRGLLELARSTPELPRYPTLPTLAQLRQLSETVVSLQLLCLCNPYAASYRDAATNIDLHLMIVSFLPSNSVHMEHKLCVPITSIATIQRSPTLGT